MAVALLVAEIGLELMQLIWSATSRRETTMYQHHQQLGTTREGKHREELLIQLKEVKISDTPLA